MEHLTAVNVALGCLAVVAAKLILTPRPRASRAPLPPGPKPLPLLGNLLDMPPPGGHDWQHWAKHKDLYGEGFQLCCFRTSTDEVLAGPISSVSVLGMNIVIVSDLQYAMDLLEKKSSISSDRPGSIFGGQLCVQFVISERFEVDGDFLCLQVRMGEVIGDVLER